MEENKCCVNGDCEKCKDQKGGMCCGHRCCGRYHLLKILVIIFLIVAIFCSGIIFGRNSDFRGRDIYQRFIMNRINDDNSNTGSVTVKVLPDTTTPVTQ